MAGLPVETNPNTGATNVLPNREVTISQGTTAQNMSGVYLADNAASVANAYSAVAAGTANPQDTSGHPGYLAVGEPGGNPSDVLVPGGLYSSTDTILDVSYPAGTAGGGGQYPQTASNPVPVPWLANAWTCQAKADEDAPAVIVVVLPEYTAAHATVVSNLYTPTISGGTSTYTVTTVEVDGVATATLPTGFTLTTSSGKIVLANTTSAGTYTLGFRVEDSSSPAQWATYEVTVVLT
jgi:hypothetical protein